MGVGMNKNEIFVFIAFAFISFFGVFLRKDLFGFDSYALWTAIASNNFVAFPNQPLANFLFIWFPTNLLFFKLFMFASFCCTLLIIFVFVRKHYGFRFSWYVPFLLLGLFPVFLFEFAKFENDLFAYPLIVLSLFLLFERKWFWCFPLLLSVGFWLWPGYFFVNALGWDVLEQGFFRGFFGLGLGVFVLPLFLLRRDWLVWFVGLFFLVVFCFQPKFWVFLVPFMVFGIGELLKIVNDKPSIKIFVLLVPLFLIFSYNIALFMQQPTLNEWEIVDCSVGLAKDTNLPLYNDWSFGYWIEHKQYSTKFKGNGVNPDYNSLEKGFLALTSQDLGLVLGCELVNEWSSSTRSIKLWKC